VSIKSLVSILLPCYNSQKFILSAINSVLSQSYIFWELLIINDGSHDSTLDLISQFSDSRINVYSQNNLGVSAARNFGLSLARGEFITLLDSDDTLPPDSLSNRVQYLNENPHVSVVSGAICRFDEDMSSLVKVDRFSYSGYMLEPLARLSPSVFTLPFYMFRSCHLGSALFNTSLSHCEDILFFLQLCTVNDLYLDSISSPVYNYRTGHPSAMSDLVSMNRCLLILNQYISSNSRISLFSKLVARIRIAKIVFLQNLKLRNPTNAFLSAWQSLSAL
jgi:glycosyltransferase involved in cell wall biosynthesis